MNHDYMVELKKINGHAALLTEVKRTGPRGDGQASHVVPSCCCCCCRFFFLSFFFPAGVWRLCRRATWPLYKSSLSRLEVCVASASPRPVFLPLPHSLYPPFPHPWAFQQDSLTQASLARLLFLCLLHPHHGERKNKPKKKTKHRACAHVCARTLSRCNKKKKKKEYGNQKDDQWVRLKLNCFLVFLDSN